MPLLGLIAGALALHALMEYRATRQRLFALTSAEAQHYANLIVRAAHDRMLLDTTLDVQRTMEHLAEDGGVTAIRIFDHGGRIVQSATDEEVGSSVRKESDEPCISCHRGARPRSSTSDVITLAGATPVLRHEMVIVNEPSCASASCHAPAAEQPILGVLDIEVTMEGDGDDGDQPLSPAPCRRIRGAWCDAGAGAAEQDRQAAWGDPAGQQSGQFRVGYAVCGGGHSSVRRW